MKVRLFIISAVLYLSILGVWSYVVAFYHISPRIIPSPYRIMHVYLQLVGDHRLWLHTFTTVMEIAGGFTIGSTFALVFGYMTAKSKPLYEILSPFIIGLHLIPKLALAPLFLIWFGFGMTAKIIITALVVFFPVYINVLFAVRSIDHNFRDLFTLYRSTGWQTFCKLELPISLPQVFTGFKTGMTLAVIGAIVAEFIGANRGLGFLIILGITNLDTDVVFAVIFHLILIGLILYEIISSAGSYLNKWHESEKQDILSL